MVVDAVRYLLMTPDERMAAFVASEREAQRRCYYAGYSFDCRGPLVEQWPMTSYGDEPKRYVMCEAHRDDYVEHWDEMWRDYYAGCM